MLIASEKELQCHLEMDVLLNIEIVVNPFISIYISNFLSDMVRDISLSLQNACPIIELN